MNLFANLNDKQTLAVQETEGYVRVIAGAGSGKTKLLVSRYAYLVKEYGIDSSNILCVTFTNKAAAEMKKRISNLIGPEYSTSLICTYHGFCARLIRENPEKLFLTKGFQILDTYQQKTILEEIYAKYELKLDYASFQGFLKSIAMFVKTLYFFPLTEIKRLSGFLGLSSGIPFMASFSKRTFCLSSQYFAAIFLKLKSFDKEACSILFGRPSFIR